MSRTAKLYDVVKLGLSIANKTYGYHATDDIFVMGYGNPGHSVISGILATITLEDPTLDLDARGTIGEIGLFQIAPVMVREFDPPLRLKTLEDQVSSYMEVRKLIYRRAPDSRFSPSLFGSIYNQGVRGTRNNGVNKYGHAYALLEGYYYQLFAEWKPKDFKVHLGPLAARLPALRDWAMQVTV